jgi:Tfp pilus assembly protein PilW
MSFNKPRSRRSRAGFTLAELMVGLGLGGLIVLVICSLALYSGISFACLANYTDMDSASLQAMDRITRDIRSANGATAVSTNSITVVTDTGAALTYSYSSGSRTLSRTLGSNTTVVLRECDAAKFLVYQRTPVSGTFNQYDVGDTNETKVVFVTWTCSRTVFGRKLTTDSASAGRVVMRVN